MYLYLACFGGCNTSFINICGRLISREATKKRLNFRRLMSLSVTYLQRVVGCYGRVERRATLLESHIRIT